MCDMKTKFKIYNLSLISMICLLSNASAAENVIITIDNEIQSKIVHNELLQQAREMLGDLERKSAYRYNIERCEEIIYFIQQNAVKTIMANTKVSLVLFDRTLNNNGSMSFSFDNNGTIIKNSINLWSESLDGKSYPANPDVSIAVVCSTYPINRQNATGSLSCRDEPITINPAEIIVIAVNNNTHSRIDEKDLVRQSQEMLDKLESETKMSSKIVRCDKIIIFIRNNTTDRIEATMRVARTMDGGAAYYSTLCFTFDRNAMLVTNDKSLRTILDTSETTIIFLFGSLIVLIAILTLVYFLKMAHKYRYNIRDFDFYKMRERKSENAANDKKSREWTNDMKKFKRYSLFVWLFCLFVGLAWIVFSVLFNVRIE